MNLKLWEPKPEPEKRRELFVRLEKHYDTIFLRVVNESGEAVSMGWLLGINAEGKLKRSACIDRALAAEVGLQLDERGRVRIEGE